MHENFMHAENISFYIVLFIYANILYNIVIVVLTQVG